MKFLSATAVVLLLLAPAAAAARAPACDVTVTFSSLAMGIDTGAFARVERYVARHRRLVSAATTTAWGHEGERTLCLTTPSRRAATTVFRDIRDLVRKGRRGPVEVRTLDGRVWQSRPNAR